MESSELELFQSIREAQSMEELLDKSVSVFNQLGIKYYFYYIHPISGSNRAGHFVLNSFPEDWTKHYFLPDYTKFDPFFLHCHKQVTPLMWDGSLFMQLQAARPLQENKDPFLNSGITIPLRGNAELGMLSIGSIEQPAHSYPFFANLLGKLYLLASYLHETAVTVNLTKEIAASNVPQLTAREKECLLWSAEGKTTWEIAQILNISERTVIFHLANAAEKMGATNRRQAVVRAIKMGLIAI